MSRPQSYVPFAIAAIVLLILPSLLADSLPTMISSLADVARARQQADRSQSVSGKARFMSCGYVAPILVEAEDPGLEAGTEAHASERETRNH